jgi:regulator of sigma E protease
MLNIIITILVLGVIVLIHELGHFLAARSIGVSVLEFSIGMGPRLYKREGRNTVFSIRAIPLGGYCLFDSDDSKHDDQGRALSILGRSPLQKIYVSLAGPVMNFVLAVLILAFLFTLVGVPVGYQAVVGEVITDSPADEAGMLSGDLITRIAGTEIRDWQHMTEVMNQQPAGETLTFGVTRNQEMVDLQVKPNFDEKEKRLLIGISVDPNSVISQRYGPIQGISLGVSRTITLSGAMLSSIGQLFSGEANVTENLSGPVGLVQIISETASTGFMNTIFLMAFLSINLGILNLLPIPALDGGKIVIYVIEIIRGKAMNQEKEGWIHMVGYLLLMGLILVLTYKDIMKIFLPE